MPQIRVRDSGGTLRTITKVRARDENNVLREIKRVRVRDAGNVLRTVFDQTTPSGSSDVVLSTYELYSRERSSSSKTVTSETVFSAVTFGTGPYTYLWEFVSGTTSIEILNPTSSSTRFRGVNFFGIKQAVYRLKVTDSLSVVKYSANLTVELEVSDD